VLSILILTAQLSVTITKHYCGGKLKSLSISQTPSGCCGESTPVDSKIETNEEPCCKNIQSIFSADVDLSFVSSYVSDYSSDIISILKTEHYITQFYFDDTSFNTLKYIPPLLGKDLCILMQRFLL